MATRTKKPEPASRKKIAALRRQVQKPAKAPEPETAEDRRGRFVRLAGKRVNRVLKYINTLGTLSSPNYKYDDKDIERMRATITATLDKTLSRFQRGRQPLPTFSLLEDPPNGGEPWRVREEQ